MSEEHCRRSDASDPVSDKTAPVTVVKTFYAAWVARDAEGMFKLLHQDVRISHHAVCDNQDIVSTVQGIGDVSRRIADILFDRVPEEYVQVILSVDGDTVHTLTSYQSWGRVTQTRLEGVLRQRWRVKDGLVRELDIYFTDPVGAMIIRDFENAPHWMSPN